MGSNPKDMSQSKASKMKDHKKQEAHVLLAKQMSQSKAIIVKENEPIKSLQVTTNQMETIIVKKMSQSKASTLQPIKWKQSL